VDNVTGITPYLQYGASLATATRIRRPSTAQQKPKAGELCLQEQLSCNAVDQRVGQPSSRPARRVGRARTIAISISGSTRVCKNRLERAEFNRQRKETPITRLPEHLQQLHHLRAVAPAAANSRG
jgi:transposase